MTRIKRGVSSKKRKKNILKQTKGYKGHRSKKYKAAKDAFVHAKVHAYRDRKKKKRTNRALQQIKINAACKKQGVSYSKFIHSLKEKNIELDRKILADLAQNNPDIFEKLIS
ncbi:MAG: 50S ribosomal protein L20 [Candidatus Pacebacteria bacterium]|nr:50S ribosomal protein L20 [Candidatus Paceibacterota bacterium]